MGAARAELIAHLRPYVGDQRVLAAIADVPRERFVDPIWAERAWDNAPLPIGEGQTISQPLVVARMCELLELTGTERVLDVGTGSGYHAAVLSRLAEHVWGIELLPGLAALARSNLAAAGIDNVTVVEGDGCAGYPQAAPYGAINVAAAAQGEVPAALEDQLAAGGRLVAPVEGDEQRLVFVRRDARGVQRTGLEPVRFVPLVPG
jgi:protein-L-isoaspartate(D-aspartate) O-methyltransferase